MTFSEWLDRLLFRHTRGGGPVTHHTCLHALLPSDLRDASFRASIEVTWTIHMDDRPTGGDEAEMHDCLWDIASKAAKPFGVLQANEAQSRVNIELGRARRVFSSGSWLVHARATLSVDTETLEFARKYDSMQRETALVRERHQAQRDRLLSLREYVLADGGTARLWWLDGNAEKLSRLVEMGGVFERAVDLVTQGVPGTSTPDAHHEVVSGEASRPDPAGELIRQFLSGLGPAHRELLISQVGRVFRSYEQPELATELEDLHRHGREQPPQEPEQWDQHRNGRN
ncbi:hypothetical protein GCM10022252_54750 [Streptosporangium oxazolinicum]|uniref:Uncharacterized protein n=1 Tax=Streptosporangium oxazolinicum TaxID=909287 RepID=A0ABP8B8M9_9ACTN